jgi:hypothetical protein
MSARPVLALLAETALDGFRIKVHASCVFFYTPQLSDPVAAGGAAVSVSLWREFDIVMVRLLTSKFRRLSPGATAVLGT